MTIARSLVLVTSILFIHNSGILAFDEYNATFNKYLIVHAQAPKKSRYTNAILKGSGIGIFSGSWSALADIKSRGASMFASWPISYFGRKLLVYPALDSYDVQEGERYRDTINDAAWISSWASYITLLALFGATR